MTLQERFDAKVSPEPTSGCHLWTGGIFGSGYGAVWDGGRHLGAHRLAWELARGPVPAGLCVLHRCDNPPCVNPSHLFLGTKGDNNRDKISKGRDHHKRKTHCPAGHPFSGANLYLEGNGHRGCRACNRVSVARYYNARKLSAKKGTP